MSSRRLKDEERTNRSLDGSHGRVRIEADVNKLETYEDVNDDRIEITVPIKMYGGMNFWISRAVWDRMSEEAQRATIADHVCFCQREIDRSGNATPGADASI